MTSVASAVDRILTAKDAHASDTSLLVGVTGIDGSGKGYVSERIAAGLQDNGIRFAQINVDGWLNLPSKRFNSANPAQHFYDHAIRFDELFAQLVLPLKAKRSLRLEAELADATDAERLRRHTYEFAEIDVILLEGIFLLKKPFRPHFDLTFWIDCSFETAFERALERGQEGLPADETIHAYETIYFPAQRIHIALDDPHSVATAVICNDSKISPSP
ncbi:MAG: uridine kinase [Planctomycetes bacterium]|nr:uridine kinase [Planctomycetota bacterium]